MAKNGFLNDGHFPVTTSSGTWARYLSRSVMQSAISPAYAQAIHGLPMDICQCIMIPALKWGSSTA